MKKGHIFIQCASYRDPELKQTVQTALDNADRPDKVAFGICWQGRMNDLKKELNFKAAPKCRVVIIHMNSSKGIGYARYKAQLMYEDEQYTLQIDSHMKFLPHWDTMCIDMLKQCPSKKAFLTAYLTDYATDPPEEPGCYRLGCPYFDENQNVVVTGQNVITAKSIQPGILASGHFVFAPSRLFREVPIDPEMQFLYEEALIAPRAWTHGWDIYYPHIAPLQHKWDRNYRKANWDDMDMSPVEKRCRKLYHQIVGISDKPYKGRYGMGNVRSLEDYERFAGINFKNQTLTKKAIKGFPSRP